MTINELHALFYSNVIAQLLSVRDEDGRTVSHREFQNVPRLCTAFEARPPMFRHNYQRNKFLRDRDKYVYAGNHKNVHLLTERYGSHVFVYKAGIKDAFGDDSDKALKVLTKLLNKFYDKVTIEDFSTVRSFDTEAIGREGYMVRFDEVR